MAAAVRPKCGESLKDGWGAFFSLSACVQRVNSLETPGWREFPQASWLYCRLFRAERSNRRKMKRGLPGHSERRFPRYCRSFRGGIYCGGELHIPDVAILLSLNPVSLLPAEENDRGHRPPPIFIPSEITP
jgi:hypothetical protein